MSNWNKYKLGEVVEIIMGQSPEGSTCNKSQSGVPLLNGPTEFGDRFPKPVQYTTDPKRFSEKGDILFCVRGSTTGRMNYSDKQYAIGRGLAAIRHKKGKELQPFVKGLIDIILPNMLHHVTGSTFPNLSKEQLNNYEVEIPSDLPTQSRIASILSSLDDKIELNRRMNQTLEHIAQALFNHYFVDNIDPDNLPEGWRKGKVQDLFILQRGFDLPASERVHGKFEVIAASGLNGFHKTAMVKGPGITTGRSGVIGNVFYISEDFWPLNTSLYIKEFKQSTPLHAFYVLKQIDLKGLNGGSAVPTLNRNHVHSLEIAIPPKGTIVEFEDKVKSLFQLKRKNEQENITIANIRDTLLPKLMSGEIDVDALMKKEEQGIENLKTA